MLTRNTTLLALLLGLGTFLGVNLLAKSALKGVSADLTEDRLFTLTKGSRNIASGLSEPISLEYYFSRSASDQVPQVKTYADRVEALLEEFVQASGGKLKLSLLDPEPFSEVEDQATAAGLKPLSLNAAGDSMFLGLVGRNTVGETERIPFFDPRQERFLEYEVAKLISTLDKAKRTKVGLLSSLPVMGGSMTMPGQRPEPAWLFVTLLRDLYEVQELTGEQQAIPGDIDVLVLIHPHDLTPKTLYAIDQYALAGRPLIAFMDGFSESQPTPPGVSPQMDVDCTSNLGPLLAAWGVDQVSRKLAGDRKLALKVSAGSRNGAMQQIDYLIYLGIGPDQVDKASPITAQLDRLVVASAGIFEKRPDSTLDYTPLVQTTEDSQEIELSMVQFGRDPNAMLKNFVPGYKQLDLAVQIHGRPRSAYPDGPPAPAEDSGDEPPAATHLNEASADFNAVLIADADLLGDQFWTQRDGLSQLFGTVAKSANNADLLMNSIELLSGDQNLISIRARGRFERPFEKVEELARVADQKFRDEADRLNQELRVISDRIRDLEAQRSDQNSLYYTPEQQAEREKAIARKLEVNKALRNVQYSLNKDVKSLGNRLMYINILAMPLVIGVLAIAGYGLRRSKRRKD